MSTTRVQTGNTEPIIANFRDVSGNGVTGLTPAITIRRTDDDEFWDGSGYAAADPSLTMTEVSAGTYPGRYQYDFDTSAGAAEVHHDIEMVGGGAATNDPLIAEVIVGGEWNNLDEILGHVDLIHYRGAIYIDTGNGAAGTEIGVNGTPDNPVDSLADAVTLAAATGLREYRIRKTSGGPLTLTSSHDDWKFVGIGGEVNIALANQDVDGSLFEDIELSGIQNGEILARRCQLDGVAGLLGLYVECGLKNNLDLAVGESTFEFCMSRVPGTDKPALDFVAAGRSANLRHYSGGLEFRNMVDANNIVTIEFVAGAPAIAATCTAGTLDIRGVGKPIDDNSAGTTIIDSGYIDAFALDLIAYQGALWFNSVGAGSAGAVVGVNGLPTNPCSVEADIRTLAAATGLRRVIVMGTLTAGGVYNGYAFFGNGELTGFASFNLNNFAHNSAFHHLGIVGGAISGNITAYDCSIGSFSAGRLKAFNCAVSGTHTYTAGTESYYVGCWASQREFGDGGFFSPSLTEGNIKLIIKGFEGEILLSEMNLATDVLDVTMTGKLTLLDSGNTDGLIRVKGVGYVDDQVTGGYGGTLDTVGFIHAPDVLAMEEALVGRIEIDTTLTPWRENHYDLATRISIVRAFELFDRSGVAISGNEASGNNPLANADVLVARKVLV